MASRKKPAKQPAKVKTKRCARCKEDKPADDKHFPPNAALADGLSAYCRPCKKKSEVPGAMKHAGSLAEEIVSQAKVKPDAPGPPPRPGGAPINRAERQFGAPLKPNSKITTEVIEKLCEVIRRGHTRTAAARYAGVKPDTLAQWMHRGKEAKADADGQLAKLVYDAVSAAEAEAEINIVEEIREEGNFDVRLKFKLLERRFPDWARKDKLEVTDNRDNVSEMEIVKAAVREKAEKLFKSMLPPAPAPSKPAAEPSPEAAGERPATS